MNTHSLAILTFLLFGVTYGWPMRDNDTSLDCVDDVEDFGWWSGSPRWDFVYSGDQLPGILQNKLEGPGIWYNEHPTNLAILTDLGFSFDFPSYEPNFMYVKYYMHFNTEHETKQGRAFPATYPDEEDSRLLPITRDFVWGELVVELNSSRFDDYYAGLSARNFEAGEYFVLEKIIIAQGFDLSNPSVNEMKGLCGWDEPEHSTTELPPTDEPPATTPNPGGDFCTEPGTFPDPVHCDKFHVCQLDDEGYIWDSKFTCPETMVWCQRTLECENPDSCPCTIAANL